VIKCLRFLEKFSGLFCSFLNINKKCGTEEKDGERQSSGEVVKKRKYRKYDDSYLDFGFTSIDDNHHECLHFVLCLKVACSQVI
jgi:dimeric dUTPase (all-alpha-NTP-PPase superfamily)